MKLLALLRQIIKPLCLNYEFWICAIEDNSSYKNKNLLKSKHNIYLNKNFI